MNQSAESKERLPWVTITFYNNGTCNVESGPGAFPSDPADIIKLTGAVTTILWQVGYQGWQGMLHNKVGLDEAYATLKKILNDIPEDATKQ